MTKMKTIKLAYRPFDSMYVVTQVTDSTEFRPGQELKKSDVDELCVNRAWRVTTVLQS